MTGPTEQRPRQFTIPADAEPALEAFRRAHAAWLAHDPRDRARISSITMQDVVVLYNALENWPEREVAFRSALEWLDRYERQQTPLSLRLALYIVHTALVGGPLPLPTQQGAEPEEAVESTAQGEMTPAQKAQYDRLKQGAAAIPAILGQAVAANEGER